VVIQDCRGTFASEGTFVPHETDTEDGNDTVAWLLEQEWCDGNVGGWGLSYMGFTQWHPAVTGTAGLKAIARTPDPAGNNQQQLSAL
jgi:putative CocE/NonD family hydrolase